MNKEQTSGRNATKHTPGPWRVYRRKHKYPHANIVQDTRGTGACAPEVGMLSSVGYAYKDEDAAMFAAAPELLKSLEQMAVFYPDGPCFCHIEGAGQPMNRHLVPPHKHTTNCIAAAAAIAKATGAP